MKRARARTRALMGHSTWVQGVQEAALVHPIEMVEEPDLRIRSEPGRISMIRYDQRHHVLPFCPPCYV